MNRVFITVVLVLMASFLFAQTVNVTFNINTSTMNDPRWTDSGSRWYLDWRRS